MLERPPDSHFIEFSSGGVPPTATVNPEEGTKLSALQGCGLLFVITFFLISMVGLIRGVMEDVGKPYGWRNTEYNEKVWREAARKANSHGITR